MLDRDTAPRKRPSPSLSGKKTSVEIIVFCFLENNNNFYTSLEKTIISILFFCFLGFWIYNVYKH